MIKNQYFQFSILRNAGILDSFKDGCSNFSSPFRTFPGIRILLFTIPAMFIFASCQKEEDLESLIAVTLPDSTIIYVHPTDNAEQIGWDELGYFIGIAALTDIRVKAEAESDLDGETNTQAIVDQIGKGNYAAKKCDELEAYGYDDWYLPAAGELAALLDQLDINLLIDYWSSTEYDDNSAWVVARYSGFWLSEPSSGARSLSKFESYSQRCRCVRR